MKQYDAKTVADILKVLSNENRLLLLCYLIESPLTVTQLQEKLPDISQSAISQHLSILKAHKMVSTEKHGQNITYNIHDARLQSVIEVLRETYCKTK